MAETLSYPVMLYLSGRNLKDLDSFSKSDPCCKLFMRHDHVPNWGEVGRTETINDNLNPNWTTTFTVPYFFEEVQHVKLVVYDDDGTNLEEIGSIECAMSDLVRKDTCILDLHFNGSPRGKVVVRSEQVRNMRDSAAIQLKGRNLDKKDFFSASDPYVIIYRQKHEEKIKVFQSEVIDNNLNPIWKPFKIAVQQLSGEDPHTPLFIECWDYDSDTSSDMIGTGHSSLSQLLEGHSIELRHKGKVSGHIDVVSSRIARSYSFLDYLRGGTYISIIAAIDFTGSNGHPSSHDSLHHLDPSHPNQYEQALFAVGSVLEPYDLDKNFPVYGFGGVFHHSGHVDHCYPLNGNRENPEVQGLQGIMQVYRETLTHVSLSGPTNLADILRNAKQIVSLSIESNQYYVLVILTDGEITDMEDTKDLIVDMAMDPISIVIIGVGNANFDKMNLLDGDQGRLMDSHGRAAARDIVQFVPFRDFASQPHMLASQVLAEIPKQMEHYMESKGIEPSVLFD